MPYRSTPLISPYFSTPSTSTSKTEKRTTLSKVQKTQKKNDRQKTRAKQNELAAACSKHVQNEERSAAPATIPSQIKMNIELSQFTFYDHADKILSQKFGESVPSARLSSSSRVFRPTEIREAQPHSTKPAPTVNNDDNRYHSHLKLAQDASSSTRPMIAPMSVMDTTATMLDDFYSSPYFPSSSDLPIRPASSAKPSANACLASSVRVSVDEGNKLAKQEVPGANFAPGYSRFANSSIPLPEVACRKIEETSSIDAQVMALESTQTDHFCYDPNEDDGLADISFSRPHATLPCDDEGYASFAQDEPTLVDVAGELSSNGSSVLPPLEPMFHAVRVGRMRGIFLRLKGNDGAKAQVVSYPGAQLQSFSSRSAALEYMRVESSDGQVRREEPSMSQEEAAMQLCAEQQCLVDCCLNGANVFFTGKAGTGKSTVLRAIVRKLEEQGKAVFKVAPTGISALNIEGQTYHSWAGWTVDTKKKSMEEIESEAEEGTRCNRLNQADVLIIDEISMIETNQFNRLDRVCRAARAKGAQFNNTRSLHSADLPFGGIQVLVTGDFRQLPPVKPFENCVRCGKTLTTKDQPRISICPDCGIDFRGKQPYAFFSDPSSCGDAWERCNFQAVQLTQVHRQADPRFIETLDAIREDRQLTNGQISHLLEHEEDTRNGTFLFPRNEQAEHHNKEELEKLRTQPRVFTCHDNFHWFSHLHPELKHYQQRDRDGPKGSLLHLRDNRLERQLTVKEGMLVMLVANMDPKSKLVNGSQGRLIGFQQYDPEMLTESNRSSPNYLEIQPGEHREYRRQQIRQWIAKRPKEESFIPIVQFLDGQICPIHPICRVEAVGDTKEYSLLSRTQIPLIPAWAITIHRSQGLSLDRTIVDLDQATSREMAYVALSRARSLYGLRIRSRDRLAVLRTSGTLARANQSVTDFLDWVFEKGLRGAPPQRRQR